MNKFYNFLKVNKKSSNKYYQPSSLFWTLPTIFSLPIISVPELCQVTKKFYELKISKHNMLHKYISVKLTYEEPRLRNTLKYFEKLLKWGPLHTTAAVKHINACDICASFQ